MFRVAPSFEYLLILRSSFEIAPMLRRRQMFDRISKIITFIYAKYRKQDWSESNWCYISCCEVLVPTLHCTIWVVVRSYQHSSLAPQHTGTILQFCITPNPKGYHYQSSLTMYLNSVTKCPYHFSIHWSNIACVISSCHKHMCTVPSLTLKCHFKPQFLYISRTWAITKTGNYRKRLPEYTTDSRWQ